MTNNLYKIISNNKKLIPGGRGCKIFLELEYLQNYNTSVNLSMNFFLKNEPFSFRYGLFDSIYFLLPKSEKKCHFQNYPQISLARIIHLSQL